MPWDFRWKMIFWMSVMAMGSMPGERLVEQHELRRDDERAGDFDPAALAARERVGGRLGERRQPQLRQELAQAGAAAGAVEVQRLEDRHDVLLDRQAAEDRGLLRQVADPLPRPDVHRVVGHVERRRAARGPESGAVSPTTIEKVVVLPAPLAPSRPMTSPGRDLDVDSLDDRPPAV